MKFSIITPCRNAERYICETIESVITQRGDFDLEYFVLDGASSDRTVEIARGYENALRSGSFQVACRSVQMEVMSEPDNGMYDALVKGLGRVSGDVVAYINADDFYLPNAFQSVAEVFDSRREVDWITAMSVVFNEKGQMTSCILPFAYSNDLIRSGAYGRVHINSIQQESTFWRSSLLKLVDLDELRGFTLAGDFYLWSRFATKSELWIIQTCLGGFRSHAAQLSRQKDAYLRELLSIARPVSLTQRGRAYLQMFGTYFLPDRLKRLFNRRILHYVEGVWR